MKIIAIEGIGPAYARKLTNAGIKTVESLLRKCAADKGRREIAEAAGIDRKLLLEWVNRADLFRIKGVGVQYSDLLEKAGVDTVVELSKRIGVHLHARMVEINHKYNCVNAMPSVKQVEAWVARAKKLPKMITY